MRTGAFGEKLSELKDRLKRKGVLARAIAQAKKGLFHWKDVCRHFNQELDNRFYQRLTAEEAVFFAFRHSYATDYPGPNDKQMIPVDYLYTWEDKGLIHYRTFRKAIDLLYELGEKGKDY